MKTHVRFCVATVLTALSAGPAAAWAQDQPQQAAAEAGQQPAQEAQEAPAPALQPAIASTLSAAPVRIDAGALGPLYVGGVLSGLGLAQSHAVPADRSRQFDLGNAQVFVNKADGLLQFFVQAGYYSTPVLGVPYLRTSDATPALFSPLAQGYLKIAPTDTLSVMVGKLPTLIGAESTFSFQNMNIQRGLLWNQENAVNRGIQVNYAAGPLTLSASVNDGFYSKRYSWITGLASYALDSSSTITFSAGANTGHTDVSTNATPLYQNNQQIYNLIYTRTRGAWTFQPYLQYTRVPRLPEYGTSEAASTYGGALLMSYDFGADATPAGLRLPGFKLPVRLEYIASTGTAAGGAPNLLYGAGSEAWSVTLTPTYQYKRFFVRTEFAYVGARRTAPGAAFGTDGNRRAQVRGLCEIGVLL
ncbi:outer membrane beta-barrel protein [Cupriavidus sp. WS]|uniref:outer membrane beta-barrel protein n=1 Tax=Cupriavidus sp. WS TaxID=1312922 RepID=UPI0003A2ECDA|nr:outer membrane beta-barrel protein [Cupriavidus sp. WS]